MSTPRAPSERKGDKVVSIDGTDVTNQFMLGANKTLACAKENKIAFAIMKSDSPSCGCGKIYNGDFDGTLVDGNGVTVDLLIDNGVKIMNEVEGELWYEQTKK